MSLSMRLFNQVSSFECVPTSGDHKKNMFWNSSVARIGEMDEQQRATHEAVLATQQAQYQQQMQFLEQSLKMFTFCRNFRSISSCDQVCC